jgi:large subunit ribosomal protein L15
MLDQLKPPPGSRKTSKRVGRGSGSGHGKTSCRGEKGQGARSGGGKGPGFEGGQMPLQRRIPKRGFHSRNRVEYTILSLEKLGAFGKNAEVTPETLKEKGLIRKSTEKVKILADGEIQVPLLIRVHRISGAARKKVEEAGGKVEVLG